MELVQQSSSYRSPAPNREHTCRCRQWPLWKNHSLPSFHPRQKSVSFPLLKAEKAWVWQTPQTLCWEDFRALTLLCDDPLGLRFRFAARMSTACCIARISQQKYDIVQSFRSSLSFKRHFCYHRVNGSCWVQVAGGCSSGRSILVTSREWWYILHEIKEAYRMWAIL